MRINKRGEIEHKLKAALAHHQAGRLAEAIFCYRKVLTLDPNLAETHSNLGTALRQQDRWDEAIVHYRKAIELRGDIAEIWSNLGSALGREGDFDQGERCCRRAIELKPDLVEAHYNLGNILTSQGRVEEALACYQRALSLKPDYADARRNAIFLMMYQPGNAPSEVYAAHRTYAERIEAPLRAGWRGHDNARDPERRLRVGYVSPDFRDHSVAFFIEPILAHHDRQRFEVFGYHSSNLSDGVTARIKACTDHWLPCRMLTDDQLAERIRADGIDLLVDLAGHTYGNRLAVFARRPAPVQISYLGYPTTTGLTAMDGRLTTADVDPPGYERYNSERLYRLPRSLWCYRPPPEARPVFHSTPVSRNGFVTFGSTNKPAKFSAATIHRWAEILNQVQRSKLLMTNVPPGAARQWLYSRFAAHGVAAERLTMLDRPPVADYWALAGQVDIALDCFPYNGTTTTCEALCMGIPVVALIGEGSAARSGYALLKAIGLAEWCAADETTYTRLAVELARDPGRLEALRKKLWSQIAASPLRDEAGITRDIEQAYRALWRGWCG